MDVANNSGNRICFRLIMCVLNYHYTSLMLNSGLLIANRIEDFVIGSVLWGLPIANQIRKSLL